MIPAPTVVTRQIEGHQCRAIPIDMQALFNRERGRPCAQRVMAHA